MNLTSKIYIDGGDPSETKLADEMLKKAGYHGLDGQTTNPTLIAKQAKNAKEDPIAFYRKTVEAMSTIIPHGKISIQVIGDPATITKEDMLTQARDRLTWIPNAVIKFPLTRVGLEAIEVFCQEGPVNVTLNFSQEQAAAVYAATKSHNYDVYISPFVGRLDDIGLNGMDVVANELTMLQSDLHNHVNVLTASVRNLKHLHYALFLKSPVITIPYKVFKEWADGGFEQPKEDFVYDLPGLDDIAYQEVSLDKDWKAYDIHHDLTDAGVAKFWEDWQSIVS